jgi:hypothetical protein
VTNEPISEQTKPDVPTEERTPSAAEKDMLERIAARSLVKGPADGNFRYVMTFESTPKSKAGAADTHRANANYVRRMAVAAGLRSKPGADVRIESTEPAGKGRTAYLYALPVVLAGTPEAQASPDELGGREDPRVTEKDEG